MRTFELGIKGTTYKVEIGKLSQSPIEVIVNGRKYSVEVVEKDSQERSPGVSTEPSVSVSPKIATPSVSRPIPESRLAPADGGKVTAPMPGKILAVNVSEGDHVQVGQVLCTLEAMKMEMAINSVSSGIVAKISVETGQTVKHGETLCIIA